MYKDIKGGMTEIEKVLKEYRALVKERADLQRRIRRAEQRLERIQPETVKVSRGRRGSHSLGVETVTGSADRERIARSLNRYRSLLRRCETDIEDKLITAEEYVQTVELSEIRQILRLRYIDGLSWEHVSIQMGGGNSADGCRMICRRWFQTYE